MVEGIICDLIIAFGGSPFDDDDKYDVEAKTIRGYCILVLVEYIILTLPYLNAFTYPITPPDHLKPASDAQPIQYSFCGFLCEILKFYDVFGVITYREDGSEKLMTAI